MSNQEILDGLHIYRMRRAYAWMPRDGRLPASEADIIAHSANMHMVPSTPELADRLRAINARRPGRHPRLPHRNQVPRWRHMAQFPYPHRHRQRRVRVSLGRRRY